MAFIIRSLFTVRRMAERFYISKFALQAWFVLSMVILSQMSTAESVDNGTDETNSTHIEIEITTTQNTTSSVDSRDTKSNTGTIVAASVITVMVCVAVVVGVYIYKRRRQSRMMDKEKKMQIQMSSARNAGVYQDLTVSVPTEDKPSASAEHERLKAAEDA